MGGCLGTFSGGWFRHDRRFVPTQHHAGGVEPFAKPIKATLLRLWFLQDTIARAYCADCWRDYAFRYAGLAAKAGDERGYPAYDKAPAALDISWCGSRHNQDIAGSYVDELQRYDGDRGG
jgi:hypothetical protein